MISAGPAGRGETKSQDWLNISVAMAIGLVFYPILARHHCRAPPSRFIGVAEAHIAALTLEYLWVT